MENIKKIFKLSNVLIVLLTIVLWIWNRLSITRMGVARHIHYKNATLFPNYFNQKRLIIITVILILFLIIEYIMLKLKNEKKYSLYTLGIFDLLAIIFMFSYDVKKIFIYYYVIIYIILINLLIFFAVLRKYLKNK